MSVCSPVRVVRSWGLLWIWVALLWMATAGPRSRATAQSDAPPIPPALGKYLARPEPKFEWKVVNRLTTPFGQVHQLRLVSQEWHDLVWEHDLHVYIPPGAKPQDTLLLWNQGGSGNEKNMLFGLEMARRVGSPIAFLYQIPNQPLFEGKKEDALIAETFVRYLETGDDSWPLLFPMVKSLVKAMDALQAHARTEWQHEIRHFVVSGASKRGWTTWLTGASDPRVKAIAPLVIDTLNMRAQGPYQLKSFGAYSDQVHDYTERKLLPMPDTPEAQALWAMVDPWVYRAKLKLPKFVLNGANDPYWTTDALNLYWQDLPGEKWVLYVPNAGHGLEQNLADGSKNRDRALNGLAAFTRHMIRDNPVPTVTWQHSDAAGGARLAITCQPAPRGARVWVARAPSRDFRQAVWKETAAVIEENQVQVTVDTSRTELTALFGEVDFEIDGLIHQFSTQLRIVEKQP